MAELPLSKFAPFCKYEAHFQVEAMNKLKELNIQCKGCIYFEESKKKVNMRPPATADGLVAASDYHYDFKDGQELYHCHILKEEDSYVAEDSFCRFFTPPEDVQEEEPDEELSIAIQKLDFTNSNVVDNINKLRDSILNE